MVRTEEEVVVEAVEMDAVAEKETVDTKTDVTEDVVAADVDTMITIEVDEEAVDVDVKMDGMHRTLIYLASNLTFTDDQWYGFDAQQRDAINALRSFRNQQRQVNRMGRDHYADHSRLRDDSSTLDTQTYHPPVRHIYELNVSRDGHPLPPTVNGEVPQPPQGGRNSGNNSRGGSVSAQNAGSAFGRRSQN